MFVRLFVCLFVYLFVCLFICLFVCLSMYVCTRQQEEMAQAVQSVGTSYTDDQINVLTQRHFENAEMIGSKWSNELCNQQEVQRREYRDWVMKVHEDTQTSATPKYM